MPMIRFKGWRQLLRLWAIALIVVVAWFVARAQWGLVNVGERLDYLGEDQPLLRVFVVNRSEGMVRFRCDHTVFDQEDVVTFGRERAYLDLVAPTGSRPRWAVLVQPLSLQHPDVVRIDVDWSHESERPGSVIISAEGSAQLQPPKPGTPAGTTTSDDAIDVQRDVPFVSRHDLPVKVDVDLGPGSGGWWIEEEVAREHATWLGCASVWRRGGSSPVAHPRQKLPISCFIPAVVNAQVIEFPWADEVPVTGSFRGPIRAEVLEISRDGHVSRHAWSIADEALLALGF